MTHTLMHSYAHALIRPYTHTLIHSYAHTLIRPYTHTLIHSQLVLARGCAYVVMVHRSDASRALNSLRDLRLGGNTCKVR